MNTVIKNTSSWKNSCWTHKGPSIHNWPLGIMDRVLCRVHGQKVLQPERDGAVQYKGETCGRGENKDGFK